MSVTYVSVLLPLKNTVFDESTRQCIYFLIFEQLSSLSFLKSFIVKLHCHFLCVICVTVLFLVQPVKLLMEEGEKKLSPNGGKEGLYSHTQSE